MGEILGSRDKPDFYERLGRMGGLAAHKKYGKEFAQRLGKAARESRMTERTKDRLIAWGLPILGTIKVRKKRYPNSIGCEISLGYKGKDGKLHQKYLGMGDTNGFPINKSSASLIKRTKKKGKDRYY